MKIIEQKYEFLIEYIKELKSIAVAFSGGVDSTFLMKVAHDVLGDKAIAITAKSYFVPDREIIESREFCQREGITHVIHNIDITEIKELASNPSNRCYVCKKEIFSIIKKIAQNNCITNVAEGSNMDDIDDYRPGMKAIKELGIISPLMKAQLTKEEIRILSNKLDLPTWNKPSFACLASRIPYGEEITRKKLEMVEQAEEYLITLGFNQMRVRNHNGLARIEFLESDIENVLKREMRVAICKKLKELGFKYISLDLQGYRTGSLNEVL